LPNRYFTALTQDVAIQAHLVSALTTDDSVQAAQFIKQAISAAASQAGMTKPVTVHRQRAQVPANRRHHQSWFDDECKRLRVLKQQTEHLHGAGHLLTVSAAREYWRYITRVQREHFEKELSGKVQQWYKSPRLFWKEFKGSHSGRLPFSVQEWTVHFKALLGNGHPAPLVGNSMQTHVAHYANLFAVATDDKVQAAACVNVDITEDEVKAGLGKLKSNKASGADGLPAEFITKALDDSVEVAIHALLPHITR